jgi:hypothetical protein
MVFAAGIALCSAWGMALNTNIDAIKAAVDSSKTPLVAEPVFPENHSYPELGPPGPYTPDACVHISATARGVR